MFSGKLNIDALVSINSTSVSTSALFHVDFCPAISRLQCNKGITSVFFARSLRSYVHEPPTLRFHSETTKKALVLSKLSRAGSNVVLLVKCQSRSLSRYSEM